MDESALLALAQCGGWATRAELRAYVGDRYIDTAVAENVIQRVGRGQYTSAGFDTTRGAARALSAVISHRSAALLHGWSIRSEPKRPELTVQRTRKIAPSRLRGCDISGATCPSATFRRICSRHRSGPSWTALVLRQASAIAGNPFESALRGLALEAVGPVFTPQVEVEVVGQRIRPDLVSESLRMVIEADSHEFHTQRAQLVRDCWRYDELVLEAGWSCGSHGNT